MKEAPGTYELLTYLCYWLHEAEYVYYDEECWLLFVWDGSVTVNIWQVTADGLYAFAVFTCGSDNPTTQTVRASILGYLEELTGDDYGS